MDNYEKEYNRLIEPLYGYRHNLNLFPFISFLTTRQHSYSINERVDMTNYNVYSIDPEGCEDADDAFSIYFENNKLFLAIHIADPTEYINIYSDIWRSITSKIVTKYPSNRKPIHMIPEELMGISSLMENSYGNIKKSITILTEIDQETYNPINKIKLMFTLIKVKQENALSYNKASEIFFNDEYMNSDLYETLTKGLKISESLQTIRSKKTKGVILNEVSNSYIKYDNDNLYLIQDSIEEKNMKNMIAEFAIFANSFVGEYLKINFEGKGIFRICNASEWLNDIYDVTGDELLNEIIKNGIRAEYLSNVSSHDLVGSPEYCHFTSPIRRMSDCICHYLLKYINLRESNKDLKVPFTNEELERYSNECMTITKKMKSIQYKDNKFRLIQVMNNILSNKERLKIGYYISSYTGLFLNIIIKYINNHKVYISYTLKRRNLTNISYDLSYLYINKVNCMREYDEGSIPELDDIYKGPVIT